MQGVKRAGKGMCAPCTNLITKRERVSRAAVPGGAEAELGRTGVGVGARRRPSLEKYPLLRFFSVLILIWIAIVPIRSMHVAALG